jgi:hypothetical protein
LHLGTSQVLVKRNFETPILPYPAAVLLCREGAFGSDNAMASGRSRTKVEAHIACPGPGKIKNLRSDSSSPTRDLKEAKALLAELAS